MREVVVDDELWELIQPLLPDEGGAAAIRVAGGSKIAWC
jgi:hypothetical protein